MATPTVIRHMTIKARGMAPDIHQVMTYSDSQGGGAVYQVYSVDKFGRTILQVSRPWGTERGAIADFDRFTAAAKEGI